MKVTKVQKAAFTPISLTITIETQDEALALWHRLNVACVKIRELVQLPNYAARLGRPYPADDQGCYPLLEAVNEALTDGDDWKLASPPDDEGRPFTRSEK